jgi:predicted enzyme related to lactoylglutathione lyase
MLHVPHAAGAARVVLSGIVQDVRSWGRRGAERLAAHDDRQVALACTIVGSLIIWCALPRASPGDVTEVGVSLVVRHFWPIAGTAAVLAVVSARWHYGLQSAALAALFVTYELEEQGSRTKNIVTIAMWAASTLLVWKLPLKNDLFRKSLIIAVTVSLPLIARRVSFEQGVVVIQFLFASAVIARQKSRSFVHCQRATSALLTMMPPTDLIGSNRSGGSILVGAGFVAGGLLGFRLFDRAASCGSSPFFFCAQSFSQSIADQVWLHPRPASLGWAAVRDVAWLASFALQYSVFVGLLNLLGIPMRFITGNMLRVRNLFDYWKTANRWQYELLRSVYLDDFFAISRGWVAAVGIVLVFVVSGLLHLPGRLPSTGSLASIVVGSEERWVVFGVLCALSYQWRVYSVRRRLEASLRGPQPSPWTKTRGIFAKLLALPLLLSVLSVSGLLIAGDEVFGSAQPYWVVSKDGPEGIRAKGFYESIDYGGPTRRAERLMGATTRVSPTLAGFGDGLYAAWRDASTPSVRWAKRDGGAWTEPQPIEGAATNVSPVLAAFGKRLFAAWTDVGSEASIRLASLEGEAWSPAGRIDGARASSAPSLASSGGRLYCAWSGVEANPGIWWASFNGRGWTTPKRIQQESCGGAPALTSVDDRLYAVWQGSGRQGRTLWWTTLERQGWAPPRQVPGVETSSGPAVAALGHHLEVAWRGIGVDPDIQWATFDGTWARPARTGLSSCDRPAAATYRGYLALAWRGKEATRCDDPSSYGGSWDLASVYFVDVPRSSSDPEDTLGRIVWRTLRTTDPSRAAAFYSDVVGWRVTTGEGGYLTLTGSRGAFGGIARISDEDLVKGVHPYWSPNVAVTDVDATVREVIWAGGRVYVGPKDAPHNVRFAIVADPSGAVLDISKLVGATSLHDSSEPGDFQGTLLTTSDGDTALRFYGTVFGWLKSSERDESGNPNAPLESVRPPGKYVTFARGRTSIGTMRVVPAQRVSWWLFYVRVANLDAAVQRAVALGGKVTVEPLRLEDGGRIAELVDPEGAPFGLSEAATIPDSHP